MLTSEHVRNRFSFRYNKDRHSAKAYIRGTVLHWPRNEKNQFITLQIGSIDEERKMSVGALSNRYHDECDEFYEVDARIKYMQMQMSDIMYDQSLTNDERDDEIDYLEDEIEDAKDELFAILTNIGRLYLALCPYKKPKKIG